MNNSTDLRAALISVFPPTPITSATIYTPDARWGGYVERNPPHRRWGGYEVRDDLTALEGKAWSELEPEVLRRHRALLTYAGAALYRVILPAYVLLIAIEDDDTPLALHVAGEITRGESAIDRQIFEERVGPMTAEQRAVIRRAICIPCTPAPDTRSDGRDVSKLVSDRRYDNTQRSRHVICGEAWV